MKTISGIPASYGIAIGPAYIFDQPEIIIETYPIKDPVNEWRRFEDAREKTHQQLDQAYLMTKEDCGDEAAEIFNAQKLMLEVKPPSNTTAYVMVLEFPGMRWYRSADLEPRRVLRDWRPALDTLGTIQESSHKSVRTVMLPVLPVRRFRLVSPEGEPLVHQPIPVSIYVFTENLNDSVSI